MQTPIGTFLALATPRTSSMATYPTSTKFLVMSAYRILEEASFGTGNGLAREEEWGALFEHHLGHRSWIIFRKYNLDRKIVNSVAKGLPFAHRGVEHRSKDGRNMLEKARKYLNLGLIWAYHEDGVSILTNLEDFLY
ncbi:hypothetical protein HG530_001117 [Fusarium avenaceum]|nr:hypothetical protein HG530_001117 [Fusarium avenaceum]